MAQIVDLAAEVVSHTVLQLTSASLSKPPADCLVTLERLASLDAIDSLTCRQNGVGGRAARC